jgi:enoyl-CoA hydratase/carnithine racemase
MIHAHTADGVETIVLDRPERRNALTRSGLTALQEAVEAAEAPVLHLNGAGTAFCAGADLETIDGLSESEAETFARQGQRAGTALETYDGVVVAGIDGPARGGGVELALACDVRIATPEATFAESGVSLGLFGAWGGTRRLPAVVGQGQALDLALSGRVLDAEMAHSIGLVSRIVGEPRDVVETIAANDSAALRTIKRLVRDQSGRETAHEREATAFGELIASLDEETFAGGTATDS